jgi:hypothetical protein
MAPNKKNAPAQPAPANLTPFAIRMGGPPPAPKRGITGEESAVTKLIKSMPAPSPDGTQIASFFVPCTEAEIPATITDPKEREKALSDIVRKKMNQLSGTTRRVTKGDATKAFAVRATTENGVRGVGVWRISVAPPAAA